MKNVKQLQQWLPEIIIIISIIYYWVMTATFLNPIALILLLVLTILIICRSALMGILISGLFLLLNLYMVLALFSELSEFPTFNKDAQIMLLFGATYLGLNIFLAIIMLLKWEKKISPASADKNAAPI